MIVETEEMTWEALLELELEKQKEQWRQKVLREHFETTELVERVLHEVKETRERWEEVNRQVNEVIHIWVDYKTRFQEACHRFEERIVEAERKEAEHKKKMYAQPVLKKQYKELTKKLSEKTLKRLTSSG